MWISIICQDEAQRMKTSDEIACRTLYGKEKLVPRERLVLRPSAYGIVLHQDKILLVRMQHTGHFALPGGGIHTGERIEDGLRREVREETGIEVRVERFAAFTEDFFYYDPLEEAFHGLLFFYICHPLSFDLAGDGRVQDGEVEKPAWIDVESLESRHFHSHGGLILAILDSYGLA
jgi:ADP-ribose pyrophosphatase YjhB (NUDIX family)